LSDIESLLRFVQFIPLEDEILDFFRPVAAHIMQLLRAKPCLPTQGTNYDDELTMMMMIMMTSSSFLNFPPETASEQWLLDKREDYLNRSMLYCVLRLCWEVTLGLACVTDFSGLFTYGLKT